MAIEHRYPLLQQGLLGSKILGASATLTGTDSGKAYTNASATGSITVNLPSATAGRVFQFLVVAAQTMVIHPTSVDSIRGTGAGVSKTLAGTPGTLLYLECIVAGTWEILNSGGGGSGTVTSVGISSTDGSVTVSGSPITGSGTIDLSVAIAGHAVPGLIPDLTLWWESDDILAATGRPVVRLRERTPWVTGLMALTSASGVTTPATVDTATLNSLPILKWTSGVAGYNLAQQLPMPLGATFFVVIKPFTSTGIQAIVGGFTNSIALYQVTSSGVATFGLVKTGVAVIGNASTAWTAGTAVQMNATYNPTTGAFAFRQARTAAGTGTGTTLANATTAYLGSDSSLGANLLNTSSIAALIVYNRVLSGAEITSVENYLFAKWGV